MLEAEALLDQFELAEDPRISGDRVYFAGQLAIILADDGRLSEALTRLTPAVAALQDTRDPDPYRHILANFAAQVLIGLGRTPEATAVLTDAERLPREQNPGWHANNQMLQIHTLVRHAGAPSILGDQLARAAEDTWERSQQAGMVNLVPIVRNLYCETLLVLAPATTNPGSCLVRARELAAENLAYAEQIEEPRSQVIALSLASRIAHTTGDTSTAENQARRAVQLLDECGGRLPALRGDEIYHHAAVVLASRDSAEAAALAARARAECERRLHLLDPGHQPGFQALHTNRTILSG